MRARHRHRRPGGDAPPALAAAAAGAAGWPAAGPCSPSAAAASAAGTGRTRCWSATSATSTCCWPGCCSGRAVLVLDHLVFAADTAAGPRGGRVLEGAAAGPAGPARAHRGRRRRGRHRGERPAGAGRPGRPGGRGAGRRAGRPGSPPGTRPARGRRGPAAGGLLRALHPAAGHARRSARRSGCWPATRGCGSPWSARGQDRAEAQRLAAGNPRVEWLDWVPAARLPELVARHDVCLGILGTGAKARRVVPNKVYQGAAAGCAVITSDTPPQRSALGDAADLRAARRRGRAGRRPRASWPATRPRWRSCARAARDRAGERFAAPAVVGTLRHRLASLPGSRPR